MFKVTSFISTSSWLIQVTCSNDRHRDRKRQRERERGRIGREMAQREMKKGEKKRYGEMRRRGRQGERNEAAKLQLASST